MITATYNPGTGFKGSTSPALTQQVVPVAPLPTSTTLLSTTQISHPGVIVGFVAVVESGGNPVTTGNVTFYDGTTVLGTSPLNSSGRAPLATTALPDGTSTVTAKYNGTTNYATSTNAGVNETVTPYTTSAAPTLTQATVGGRSYTLSRPRSRIPYPAVPLPPGR